jgi:Egh16-like virulence factor
MQYSSAILLAAFAATNVLAHGVITSVEGANGVTMPGLSGKFQHRFNHLTSDRFSVADGTPRDCATPACGAEADTSIIRKNELGTSKASALGRTVGAGPVDAATMVAAFMDGPAGNTTSAKAAREFHLETLSKRALTTGGGTKTPKGTVETGVKAAVGQGATSGLPTCSDTGVVTMTFHQVNQDGAGPLTAAVDPTSGGTDPTAFQSAQVTQNVPGLGIGGLSAVTTTDFPVAIQMPAGMTCSGQVGGASNVCIARLQNSALAGPFGGSVAFTQSPAAKKRAIEYNLARRRFARGLVAGKEQ